MAGLEARLLLLVLKGGAAACAPHVRRKPSANWAARDRDWDADAIATRHIAEPRDSRLQRESTKLGQDFRRRDYSMSAARKRLQ